MYTARSRPEHCAIYPLVPSMLLAPRSSAPCCDYAAVRLSRRTRTILSPAAGPRTDRVASDAVSCRGVGQCRRWIDLTARVMCCACQHRCMAAVRLPAARYARRSRRYFVTASATTEDRRACLWGASACTTSGLLSCGVATQLQASAQQDECKTAQRSVIKVPNAAAGSGILRGRAQLSS